MVKPGYSGILGAFLVVRTSQLCALNPKLQYRGNTLCELMAAVRFFKRWLENLQSDITDTETHLQLSTLLEQNNDNHRIIILESRKGWIRNFRPYFDSSTACRQVLLCTESPFLGKIAEEFL